MFEGLEFKSIVKSVKAYSGKPFVIINKSDNGSLSVRLNAASQKIADSICKGYSSVEYMIADMCVVGIVPIKEGARKSNLRFGATALNGAVKANHINVRIPVTEHKGMLVFDLRSI